MFVRFRQRSYRLQASLIETRRVDGKVRHEHIASFGAVPEPPSIADRVAFWKTLHERLAKLSNRVSAEAQSTILGSIHARIPMPTTDEQRTLQLENAENDANFWDNLDSMYAGSVADQKGMIALAERKAAENEVRRSHAAKESARAKDRVARIKRGENVEGGLGESMGYKDYERILLDAGMTKKAIVRCQDYAVICKAFGDEAVSSVLIPEIGKRHKRVQVNVHRDLLKLLRDKLPAASFNEGIARLIEQT